MRRLYTHTRPLNGRLSGTTQVSRYQKGKTNLDFLNQETVSGSGISWAICKSAPRSRQTTTPAPHHSVFYRPDAILPPNRQRQSTESKCAVPLVCNKSAVSFVRTLLTWHCPHSPAACRTNRPIFPVLWAHSSISAAAGLLLWAHAGTDRQTDGRTLYRHVDLLRLLWRQFQ